MDGLLQIAGCDNPVRLADVVFVHGLDGDARTTWHPKDSPAAFWPAWLGEDVPTVGVLEHPSFHSIAAHPRRILGVKHLFFEPFAQSFHLIDCPTCLPEEG